MSNNNQDIVKEEEKINFQSLILDSLKDNLGILNKDGVVVFINNAWKKFDESNERGVLKHIKVGMNFLELYEKYVNTPHIAYDILNGIKDVIDGKVKEFTFEYSRPLNEDNKSFLFRVYTAFENSNYIIISHADITDRKKIEDALKENKEISLSFFYGTTTIMLIIDPYTGNIAAANPAACKFYGYSNDEFVNENIMNINLIDKEEIKAKMMQALNKKSVYFEFQHRLKDGRIKDIESHTSPIRFRDNMYLFSIIHDISDKKTAEKLLRNSMERAAKIQRQSLDIAFPLADKAKLKSVYMPAQELSGDFFRIRKVKEHEVIGIVGDVAGKGIEAALSVNGIKMLFSDGVLFCPDPLKILNYLNNKVSEHMEDEYVAACCFKLDFINKQAVIACAGINEFWFHKKGHKPVQLVVKGAFLGMFKDSMFEECTLNFDSGDRFYFHSDGLENLFNSNEIIENCFVLPQLDNVVQVLKSELNKQLLLKDDCTFIGIEII